MHAILGILLEGKCVGDEPGGFVFADSRHFLIALVENTIGL